MYSIGLREGFLWRTQTNSQNDYFGRRVCFQATALCSDPSDPIALALNMPPRCGLQMYLDIISIGTIAFHAGPHISLLCNAQRKQTRAEMRKNAMFFAINKNRTNS
jgi:hypothetical protein